MEFKKIFFHSNRLSNEYKDVPAPEPASKNTPKWYQDSDIYIKMPNGEAARYPDGSRALGYKSCPAILDLYTTGYVLKTPCDITFELTGDKISVNLPMQFKDFCEIRPGGMSDFAIPSGHYESSFHFYPTWAPELPEGYSALYVTPLNHFELPFTMVAGIIDNDKFNTPGLMPFFLKKEFNGVLPKGTPFVQIIPFKREDWEMDVKLHNQAEIFERSKWANDTFRIPDGGVYKKSFWTRRKYR